MQKQLEKEQKMREDQEAEERFKKQQELITQRLEDEQNKERQKQVRQLKSFLVHSYFNSLSTECRLSVSETTSASNWKVIIYSETGRRGARGGKRSHSYFVPIHVFFYKNIKTEGSLQMFLVFSVLSLKMVLTCSYFVENSSSKL